MSGRSAARGSEAARSIRLAPRTSTMVAASRAKASRCALCWREDVPGCPRRPPRPAQSLPPRRTTPIHADGADRHHRPRSPTQDLMGGEWQTPGRSGEREASLRTGAVLVVGRSVAWRTPAARADRPFLLDHFAALEDPRQRAKVLYPLPDILLLLLCATLAGADDVVEIALWGDEHLAFLRRFLPCKHGVPSHDTLGEVLAALDPGLFKACFMSWVEGLREAEPDLIAIDGKTSRRSHARSKGL